MAGTEHLMELNTMKIVCMNDRMSSSKTGAKTKHISDINQS